MARAAGGDRDSRLNGARLIGLNSTVSGTFPRKDLDDLVRLNVAQRSSFNLDLTGVAKKNNVDVELYRFVRPVADVLKSIGKTDIRRIKGKDRNANFQFVSASKNGSNRNEKITAELDTGDYFIRFLKRGGNNTKYVAAIQGSAIITPPVSDPPVTNPPVTNPPVTNPPITEPPVTPPITPPVTPVPLALGTATTNQLNATTPERRYAIDVARGDFQIDLTGLSADADLQVLSADGKTVINSLTGTGTTERTIQPLEQGKYLLRVFRKAGNSANTNFTLKTTKRIDAFKNTEAEANDLGTLGSATVPNTVGKANYVVTGGKDSPVDYFKFKVQQTGYVEINLVGASIGGQPQPLFGDLDIDIYEPGATAEQVYSSARVGNVAEVGAGKFESGTTYLIRVKPKTGITTGSTYNLNLSLTQRSNLPTIIRNTVPGDATSDAKNFTEVGGLAYFSSKSINNQGEIKTSLWKTQGTLTRTTKLFDFQEGAAISDFTNVGNQLYFVANTPTEGTELWTSDGTLTGTKRVADLAPGAASSTPSQLTVVGTDLYFYTTLSASAGTGSTKKLYRLQPNSTPTDITGNSFKKVVPTLTDPQFSNLTAVGNSLYFSAFDGEDTELWQATGSTITQMRLRDIGNGEGGSNPENFTAVGDKLFVTATVKTGNGGATSELVRVDNFASGFNQANFTAFNLNGAAPSNPADLLYIPGATAGTDTLYFAAADTGTGLELRKITAPGTATATSSTLVKNINAGAENANPKGLLSVGNQVIFVANDGVKNDGLWISDGTDAGTRKLSTLNGLSSLDNLTNPKQFTVVNGTLFFTANAAATGDELYKLTLNGNSGTLVNFDIRKGIEGSTPAALIGAGNQLFFVADDGLNGIEPWSIPA